MASAPRSASDRSFVWYAVVGLIYSATAVLVTYPLIRHVGERVAGNSSDIFIYPWAAWWIRESVRQAEAVFYTPFLYFPEGASLAFHNLVSPLTGWILLLPASINLIAFYNMLVLVAFVASAVAAYLLALYVARSHAAAFIGGLVFAFAPYRVEQARSHLTTVGAMWLPLFVLGGLWLCRASTRRQQVLAAIGAALAAVLALLTRADHFIAGVYILGILILYPPFPRRELEWRGRLIRVAAIGMAAVILALPYLSVWFRHGEVPKLPNEEIQLERSSVSVDDLVKPAPRSLLWTSLAPAPFDPKRAKEKVAFLGFVMLACLGAGVYLVGRERAWRFWMLGGVFFVIVALGPDLVVGDRITSVPLPYEWLPGIDSVRNPRRFVSAAMLCFAMAAALSWRALLERLGTPTSWRWWAPTLVLGGLLVLENAAPPLPMMRPMPSPFYQQLAASADKFGLVEIPSNTRQHDKLYMFYQTMHGKPIHAGHMGRIPDETFHFVRAVNLLNYVAHEGHVARPGVPVDVSQDLDILRANNFRYIIFHRRFDEGEEYPGINRREAKLMKAVGKAIGPPVYDDRLITVFDLRRAPMAGVVLTN